MSVPQQIITIAVIVLGTVLTRALPFIIFPEGTRTKPGEAGGYKPGAAFLYQNTDVPVVPVALNSALFWAKKSFLRKPGKIIIEFLPSVPRGLDKREFMSFLKSRIEEKCTELNEETIKNYPETKQLLHKK